MVPRAFPLLRRVAAPALLLTLSVLILFAVRGSFAPGYLASWDGPGHVARAEHFFASLDTRLWGIYGWYPGWYLGEPLFFLYPPGFFLVPALMRILTLGLVPISLAMKLIPALTYAAFPPVLYWLARRLHMSSRQALAAAIVSVTFSGLAIGAEGIYDIGLYTAIFALLPFMGFWGMLHQTLDGGRDRSLLAGLLLAWIISMSIIAGVYTLLFFVVYVLLALALRRHRRTMRHAAVIALVGFLGSHFWTLPLLRSQWLAGPNVGWNRYGVVDLAENLMRGRIILPQFVGLLATLGVLACVWFVVRGGRQRFAAAFLLLLVPMTLVVTSDLLVPPGSSLEDATGVLGLVVRVARDALQVRAVMFLWVLLPLLAAIAFEALLTIPGYLRPLRRALPALTVLSLAALLFASWPELSRVGGRYARTVEAAPTAAAWEQTEAALHWLRDNAPPDSVVVTAMNYEGGGYPGTYAIDALLNLEAGQRSLGGQQLEAAQISLELLDRFRKPERNDPIEGPLLDRFNVSYVLSYRNPPYVSRYLRPVYQRGDFTIYQTHDLPRAYRRLSKKVGVNRHDFVLELPQRGVQSLPIQYNDHWEARVDGELSPVGRGDDGLVVLDLPAGRHTVELRFGPEPVELVALLVSTLTVLVVLVLLARDRWSMAGVSLETRGGPWTS